MIRGLAALAVVAALTFAAPAGAVLTPNLVQNPGAGLGSAGEGDIVDTIPGWVHATGASPRATVVKYGAPGFPTKAQSDGIGGGSQFFAGGPSAAGDTNGMTHALATIGQQFPIPADVANLAKAGGAQATLAGCLGGYADQDDRVEVVLWQMAGAAIRDELVLSGPDAAARGGLTGLLARSSTVDVRPDATSMVVRARFMRASGANTYNDAYADNISLRISEVGATPPEPPCSPEAPTDPGDPQPPAPKPDPGKPSPGGSNTAVPLARVGKRVKLDGRVAKLKLFCAARDGACRGSLTLKQKSHRLGGARFRIGAGKVGTVKVKLGRKVRRHFHALSRRQLARVKITATAKIGKATTKFTFGAAR